MAEAVVVGHAAFTLAMVGLMATVQLVVYPQFRNVDAAALPKYAADHSNRIVAALVLFAPAEVILAGWIFLDPPAEISRLATFVSGALLAAAWGLTAIWYGPLHGYLMSGEDRVDQLIRTNWVRTLLWFARGGFAVWFIWQLART